MNTASKRVVWMIISGGVLTVLLAGALSFLLYREFSFRELELKNTMENYAFAVMEVISSDSDFDIELMSEEITGIGLYLRDGKGSFVYGTAPLEIGPESARYIDSIQNTGSNVYRMLKALGGGQPQMGIRGGRNRVSSISGMLLLIDYNATSLLAGSTVVSFILISIVLLIIILGITLVILLRKISAGREEQRQKEKLVQLGHASRTLSHEIKNPLAIIRMQQAVLKKKLDEEFSTPLSVIDTEVIRITNLVDRVGNFLKADTGILSEIEIVPFVSELSQKLPFDIKLSAALPEETVIFADKDKLRSVLENILQNGFESMDEEGPIIFAVSIEGKNLQFSIKDNGCGIDSRNMNQVFDPFFTTKENGQGIGLSVARNFINIYNGKIEIDNRKSGGTEVRINIPLNRLKVR